MLSLDGEGEIERGKEERLREGEREKGREGERERGRKGERERGREGDVGACIRGRTHGRPAAGSLWLCVPERFPKLPHIVLIHRTFFSVSGMQHDSLPMFFVRRDEIPIPRAWLRSSSRAVPSCPLLIAGTCRGPLFRGPRIVS